MNLSEKAAEIQEKHLPILTSVGSNFGGMVEDQTSRDNDESNAAIAGCSQSQECEGEEAATELP